MTVSMGIEHKDSGRYDVVPIATTGYFESHWLPACAHLGLQYVSHFHDGGLPIMSFDDLGEICAELETLRAWAVVENPFIVERIDGVLRAIRASAGEPCEYDFG